MPTTRRRIPRNCQELPPEAADWLRSGSGGAWHYFQSEDALAELWREHADAVVAEHVAENPGTRPPRWWEYCAPEPRRRLSGVGTPRGECLLLGVPDGWIEQETLELYKSLGEQLEGSALDDDDPPMFEAQAAYLERLGLLLRGERRRLKGADFEPESVVDILGLSEDDEESDST